MVLAESVYGTAQPVLLASLAAKVVPSEPVVCGQWRLATV